MKTPFIFSRNAKILTGLTLLLLVGLGTSLFLYFDRFQEITAGPVQLQLNDVYVSQSFENQEKSHTKRLMFLKRSYPTTTLTVDKEEGAIAAANLTHANFLDTLDKNAKRAFPLTYPQYKEQSVERIKVQGYDATRIRFTYNGGKHDIYGESIIVPLDNDALYITLQSESEAERASLARRVEKSIRIQR